MHDIFQPSLPESFPFFAAGLQSENRKMCFMFTSFTPTYSSLLCAPPPSAQTPLASRICWPTCSASPSTATSSTSAARSRRRCRTWAVSSSCPGWVQQSNHTPARPSLTSLARLPAIQRPDHSSVVAAKVVEGWVLNCKWLFGSSVK